MLNLNENVTTNAMGMQGDDPTKRYTHIFAQTRLKSKFESSNLNASDWKRYQPFVSNRKWIHALKLGLLSDEDSSIGMPSRDSSVNPEMDSAAYEHTEVIVDEVETLATELVENISVESTEESIREKNGIIAKESAHQQKAFENVEDESSMKEEPTPSNLESTERDEEENTENSSFISWLHTLPKVKGYKDLTKKKTKAEKKKLKKAKKKAEKKQKEILAEEDNSYKDLVISSMELGNNISSEPLAKLLQEHGHHTLAKKIYERLMVKYPEKSSYFAARIRELKEED